MSTYWYFECLSHDPPLRSDGEFTQHTEDEHYVHALELAAQRPLERPDDDWWYADENWHPFYYERQARWFLQSHPACALGLVNEYGDRRPLTPPARSTGEGRCARCGTDLDCLCT